MKKKVKQILSALLVAVMLVGFAPVGELTGLDLDRLGFSTKSSALEASGQCGENVYYTFDESTGLLTVSGEGEMRGRCFDGNSEIKTVVVEDGVTSIGVQAFYECTGLTSVTIGKGVTSIGDGAFSGCTGLTSITIGDSVTSIGNGAFYGCTGLTSVTIPDSVTRIDYNVFSGCTGLTSITIPDSVTSIGRYAFEDCTGLTSISVDSNNKKYDSRNNCNAIIETESNTLISGCKNTVIPDSVTSIGDRAFCGCTGLTSITIPNSVTNIDEYAFRGCTGLTSITIPDSVKKIGICVFAGCSSLTSISIPNSITSIPLSTFDHCSNLTSITIPDNVTSIESYAFFGCTGLNSIFIPEGVTRIGVGVFSHCTGLINITVSEKNKVYDSRENCNAVIESKTNSLVAGCKGTIIPGSVLSIGKESFYEQTDLTSIIIPDSLMDIGTGAFWGCSFIKDVYYTGSESEWNEIAIASDNECLTNATIHYNYSGSHTHTLKHITVPSTCKVAGMEYDICSECGETFNEKTLPLAAHTWSEWTVVKEATTTAEGQEKRTCSVCDKVETRAIEKLKVIKDDKTGIEINYNDEYDSDTEIKVEEQFSGKSFQLINTEFGKVNSKIYDIATYKDGVKVQPNGEITVKVPLPDGFTTNKVFVCYVDSVSGKVTKIPCEVKDGYVIFKTNHFSEYAIVEQSANVKSVSVSDIKLNYKKSTTIMPSITADDGAKYTVKYSSSNTKVATVDENGKVYAAKKGSATITCTVTDSNGNTVQDTCKVTVKYSFGQWLIKILLFGWIWY